MVDWLRVIDDLLEYEGEALTAWEVEFVDSLDKQRQGNDDWYPSQKQIAVLDKLMQKI